MYAKWSLTYAKLYLTYVKWSSTYVKWPLTNTKYSLIHAKLFYKYTEQGIQDIPLWNNELEWRTPDILIFLSRRKITTDKENLNFYASDAADGYQDIGSLKEEMPHRLVFPRIYLLIFDHLDAIFYPSSYESCLSVLDDFCKSRRDGNLT